MNHFSFTPCAIRFRRFSGKAYAAFCSMHRVVTIGRVCARIANLEMLKAGRSVLVCAAAFVGGIMYADEPQEWEERPLTAEQLTLSELQVVAQRAEVQSSAYRLVSTLRAEDIAQLPVETVSDLLRYVPGVDIRSRGANGAQADVSMRGGTFDQVLVMINGVNLTDAHTGHYSLNLPIDVSLIDRIEILQGTSASLFGLNAFAGAINIITKSTSLSNPSLSSSAASPLVSLRLTAGMNNMVAPAFSARAMKNDWYINASANYTHSAGYYAPSPSEVEQQALNNSGLDVVNLYLQTGFDRVLNNNERSTLDIQVGAQYKDAGAGMFYGLGSREQFDATRTAFGSASYTHVWGAWSLDAQAMYRANYDRYEWWRNRRIGGNFHFTQNTAASLRAHYASRIGRTTVGLELRNENIHSTNLGDTVNANGQVPNKSDDFKLKDVRVLDLVKGGNRLNVNYFVEQSFFWNNLSASLGVSGNWNSMFGNNLCGGANIGYEYARDSRVYINANRSLRLPTFTDLYYKAGEQLGNRNLKPEEAWTLSLGTQFNHTFAQSSHRLSASVDAYYRWGRNIIDWVYTEEDPVYHYHAQNWNRVNSAGVETSIAYFHNEWLRSVSLRYAYTYLDLDEVNKQKSRYLDYLSHKLVASLNHGIYVADDWTLGANWNFVFQQREGTYDTMVGSIESPQKQTNPYRPVCLLDLGLYWELRMKAGKSVKISADCTNITNTRYYDYGGILQPGAWAKLTAQIRL